MRRPTLSDVSYTAICLTTFPEAHWRMQLSVWLDNADLEDRYRKRTRRRHPKFGAGFLADAVKQSAPKIMPEYDRLLAAQIFVLREIQMRRTIIKT